MNRESGRWCQATAVLLSLFMVLSIAAVFAGTAAARTAPIGQDPAGPDVLGPDGTTTGTAPTDNATAPNGSVLETAGQSLADQSGDATLGRAQLDTARQLRAIAADSSTSERDRALAMAEAVLDQRRGWAESADEPLDPSMVALFQAQQTKLDGARRLLAANQELQDADSLTRAVELAKLGTKMQATQADDSLSMDSDLPDVATQNHASPSAALAELMVRYGATPTAEDVAAMRSLDDLPPRTRTALTDYVDAFLAFQRTTAEGDATRIFAARTQLLDETEALHDAFESTDSQAAGNPYAAQATSIGCGTHTAEGTLENSGSTFCVFGLDASLTVDTRYDENHAVLIDTGGDDTYKNNAGGTNLDDNCGGAMDIDGSPSNNYVPLNNSVDSDVAAALVDFSGSDDYTRTAGYGCGQRGGGHQGSGYLVDLAGSDLYGDDADAYGQAHQGTNGGSYAVLPDDHSCCTGGTATGFLLDAGTNNPSKHGGKDKFRAGSFGTNGGGDLGGQFDEPVRSFGFLMNVEGPSLYKATSRATNGGSVSRGSGFLADLETGLPDGEAAVDVYKAESAGTNGGGQFQGKGGFLLDAAGSDTYEATSLGTNGGGSEQSTGFLLDAGPNRGGDGQDTFTTGKTSLVDNRLDFLTTYETDDYSIKQGMMGVNGGAKENSVGTLIDEAGDTTYKAGDGQGANGGAYETGAGVLVDGGGSDTYTAGYDPTHGKEWEKAGSSSPSGVFHGKVQFPTAGTNGGGAVNGVGAIVDAGSGEVDVFDAQDGHYGGINGTNGGAWALGVGFAATLGGSATYTATSDLSDDETNETKPASGPVSGANGGGSGYGQFKANSQRDEFQDFTGAQWTPATYGAGTLVDINGDDSYTAVSPNNATAGVNGGAAGTAATGVLVDVLGSDTYEQNDCGPVDDDTWLPKGKATVNAGAQIDSNERDPRDWGCGTESPA